MLHIDWRRDWTNKEKTSVPMKLHQLELSAHILLLMKETIQSNNLLKTKGAGVSRWLLKALSSTWERAQERERVGEKERKIYREKDDEAGNVDINMKKIQHSLCIDDFGQAVPPHTTFSLRAGLEEGTLPTRFQGAHSQTGLQLLHWDPQQLWRRRQENYGRQMMSYHW